MLTRGVALVELSPPVAVTAALCWDKCTPATAAARAFLDFVREHAGASGLALATLGPLAAKTVRRPCGGKS